MRILLYSFCLFFLTTVNQNIVAQKHIGIDILDGKESIKLPIEHRNGFIIVKAKFAKFFNFNFILDTGSSNSIIFDKIHMDAIGANYTDTIEVYGADLTIKQEALVVREIPIKIDKQPQILRDFIVLQSFNGKINNIIGENIHGILGGDFIKGLVLTINYKKKYIKLSHPDHFQSNDHSIPIKLLNKKPYIISEVATSEYNSLELLLLDTGSKIPIILRSIDVRDTTNSIHYIGHGLNGPIFGKLGFLKSFNMGPYQYTSVVYSSQIISDSIAYKTINAQAGLIGQSILSKFELSIDYSKLKVYIKPLTKTLRNINTDQSGLVLHLTGKNYDQMEVIYVLPNSIADLNGIREGDIIKKVGIWPVWLFSYEGIQKRLEHLDKRPFKVTLKRGNRKIKRVLKKNESSL